MNVFLSHASQDKGTAESIAFSLRNRGCKVFLDRDDLPAGASYDQQIERAVNDSDIFIFLISPDSASEGRYTLTEMGFARQKWPDPNGRVLPVMARKTPPEQVPSYLKAVSILEPLGNVAAETSARVDKMRPGSSRFAAELFTRYRYLLAFGALCGIAGMVVYFGSHQLQSLVQPSPTPPRPAEALSDSNQDEALLARGTTKAFYGCRTHAQCQPGYLCVDNGGDKGFFCKPICNTDTDCTHTEFPESRCFVHLRANGTMAPHRVCNATDRSYLK